MILIRDTRPEIEVARHGGRVEHHAVDPAAHPHLVRIGLEVDVGGAAAHRVRDHRVHELHDRRVVGRLAQLDHLRLDLVVLDLVDRALERPEVLDQRVDVLRRGDGAADLEAGGHGDVVEREQVGGVGGRHEQLAVGQERDRDRAVAARLAAVDHAGRALVHVEHVQVHVVEAVALGERLRELPRVDDAGLDQRLARAAGRCGGRPRPRCSTSSRSAKPSWTITSPMRRLTPVRFVGGVRPGTGNGPAEAA